MVSVTVMRGVQPNSLKSVLVNLTLPWYIWLVAPAVGKALPQKSNSNLLYFKKSLLVILPLKSTARLIPEIKFPYGIKYKSKSVSNLFARHH